MNSTLVGAVVSVAALSIIGLPQSFAGADPTASTTAAAKKRPPITATAPCSGSASVYVKLINNPEAHQPDRLKVGLFDGHPKRRWTLTVAVYQGDSGSVLLAPQRTDADGEWTLRTSGASGFQRIEVDAKARRSGQVCEVDLSGRVAPPQSGTTGWP